MRVRNTERLYKIGLSEIIFDFEEVEPAGSFVIYRHQLPSNQSLRSVSRSTEEQDKSNLPFVEVFSYQDLIDYAFAGDQSGAYFYDTVENDLYFKNRFGDIADEIEGLGLANYLKLDKFIFYSDFKDLTTFENPLLTSGQLRLYENRVLSKPDIQKDFSDSFFGVLSVSTNNIKLNNRDAFLNKFFEANVTFYDQPVQIFRRDNFDQEFVLEAINSIRNFESDKQEATLELVDFNYQFNSPYTSIFNDTPEQQTWVRWLDLKPSGSIDSSFRDLPLYESIGTTPVSTYQNTSSVGESLLLPSSIPSTAIVIATESMIQMCNVDDAGSASTTNNRKWSLGVTKAGTQSNGVYNCTVDGADITVDTQGAFNGDLLQRVSPGEWCFIAPIAGTGKAARLVRVDEAGIACFRREPDISNGSQALSFTFSSVPIVYWQIERTDSEGVVELITGEVPIDLYTVSDEDLGLPDNKVFKNITFVDGFEVLLGLPVATRRDQKLLAKYRDTSTQTTALNTIKNLLESSGTPVNSNSFNAAASVFDTTIGYKYNHDLNKQDMLELLLESVFGYLSLNNQGVFEFFYHAVQGENKSINRENISIFSETIDASYDERFNSIKPIHENRVDISRGVELSPRIDCPFAKALDGRISVKETRTILAPQFEPRSIMDNVFAAPIDYQFTFNMKMASRFLRNVCSGFYNYDATLNEDEGLIEIADSINSDFLRTQEDQTIEITYIKDQTLRKTISGYRLNREDFPQVMFLKDVDGQSVRYSNIRKEAEESGLFGP